MAREQKKPDALRVDLAAIELGSHPLEVQIEQAWITQVLAETDAQVASDGAARLELTIQADKTILVRGRLEIRYHVPCARCLEPAVVDVADQNEELCVTYVPAERLRSWAEFKGAPEDEDEIEPLDSAELDEIGYQGTTLDLRSLISEQTLLAYPMRALCSYEEACLGLCMRCGTELNAARSPDGTPPKTCPSCGQGLLSDGAAPAVERPESPWSRALSKVKLDGGNE